MMIHHKGWWIPEINEGGKSGIQGDKNLRIIDLALEHVATPGLVLQAGAYNGQWADALARKFTKVVSVEGDPVNFECAVRNLAERAALNVDLRHAILGETAGLGRMVVHNKYAAANHAVYGSGEVPVITIDSLELTPDLIMLDIEGAEVIALKGAVETLKRCSPPIVLEDNKAREHFQFPVGHQRKFMAKLGYVPVQGFIKDVIYVRK